MTQADMSMSRHKQAANSEHHFLMESGLHAVR